MGVSALSPQNTRQLLHLHLYKTAWFTTSTVQVMKISQFCEIVPSVDVCWSNQCHIQPVGDRSFHVGG
jgi:hypothetical protein